MAVTEAVSSGSTSLSVLSLLAFLLARRALTHLRPWLFLSPPLTSSPASSVLHDLPELSMKAAARGMRSRCSLRSAMNAGDRWRSTTYVDGGDHGPSLQSSGVSRDESGGECMSCEEEAEKRGQMEGHDGGLGDTPAQREADGHLESEGGSRHSHSGRPSSGSKCFLGDISKKKRGQSVLCSGGEKPRERRARLSSEVTSSQKNAGGQAADTPGECQRQVLYGAGGLLTGRPRKKASIHVPLSGGHAGRAHGVPIDSVGPRSQGAISVLPSCLGG